MGKRIRKSLVGGLAAGLSAVAGNLSVSGAPTRDEVSKAVGTFLVAFAVGAYAVWRVPNQPTAA